MFKTLKAAEAVAGTLSKPSKMPGYSYGLPAEECKVGRVLVKTPGSVCETCYALKGRYVFPNVKNAQYRRLGSIRDIRWVDAMVFMIKKRAIPYFRWHDSGDIQDDFHLKQIVKIAELLPDITFWLPTREQGIVRAFTAKNVVPSNLTIRISATMIDGPSPKLLGLPTSEVISSETLLGPSTFLCPAPKNEGVCGTCRACWDPSVPTVTYLKH